MERIGNCSECGADCYRDDYGRFIVPSPAPGCLCSVKEDYMDEEQIRKDAMIMALRLLGEDEGTFSPECREVMDRWRPVALAYFREECGK